MSKLNDAILYILYQVNIAYSFIGCTFFAIALYIIFADWGTLDASYFLALGISVALFGVIVMTVSCLGCLGIDHQRMQRGACNRSLKYVPVFYSW